MPPKVNKKSSSKQKGEKAKKEKPVLIEERPDDFISIEEFFPKAIEEDFIRKNFIVHEPQSKASKKQLNPTNFPGMARQFDKHISLELAHTSNIQQSQFIFIEKQQADSNRMLDSLKFAQVQYEQQRNIRYKQKIIQKAYSQQKQIPQEIIHSIKETCQHIHTTVIQNAYLQSDDAAREIKSDPIEPDLHYVSQVSQLISDVAEGRDPSTFIISNQNFNSYPYVLTSPILIPLIHYYRDLAAKQIAQSEQPKLAYICWTGFYSEVTIDILRASLPKNCLIIMFYDPFTGGETLNLQDSNSSREGPFLRRQANSNIKYENVLYIPLQVAELVDDKGPLASSTQKKVFYSKDFMQLFDLVIRPVVRQFKPDLVVMDKSFIFNNTNDTQYGIDSQDFGQICKLLAVLCQNRLIVNSFHLDKNENYDRFVNNLKKSHLEWTSDKMGVMAQWNYIFTNYCKDINHLYYNECMQQALEYLAGFKNIDSKNFTTPFEDPFSTLTHQANPLLLQTISKIGKYYQSDKNFYFLNSNLFHPTCKAQEHLQFEWINHLENSFNANKDQEKPIQQLQISKQSIVKNLQSLLQSTQELKFHQYLYYVYQGKITYFNLLQEHILFREGHSQYGFHYKNDKIYLLILKAFSLERYEQDMLFILDDQGAVQSKRKIEFVLDKPSSSIKVLPLLKTEIVFSDQHVYCVFGMYQREKATFDSYQIFSTPLEEDQPWKEVQVRTPDKHKPTPRHSASAIYTDSSLKKQKGVIYAYGGRTVYNFISSSTRETPRDVINPLCTLIDVYTEKDSHWEHRVINLLDKISPEQLPSIPLYNGFWCFQGKSDKKSSSSSEGKVIYFGGKTSESSINDELGYVIEINHKDQGVNSVKCIEYDYEIFDDQQDKNEDEEENGSQEDGENSEDDNDDNESDGDEDEDEKSEDGENGESNSESDSDKPKPQSGKKKGAKIKLRPIKNLISLGKSYDTRKFISNGLAAVASDNKNLRSTPAKSDKSSVQFQGIFEDNGYHYFLKFEQKKKKDGSKNVTCNCSILPLRQQYNQQINEADKTNTSFTYDNQKGQVLTLPRKTMSKLQIESNALNRAIETFTCALLEQIRGLKLSKDNLQDIQNHLSKALSSVRKEHIEDMKAAINQQISKIKDINDKSELKRRRDELHADSIFLLNKKMHAIKEAYQYIRDCILNEIKLEFDEQEPIRQVLQFIDEQVADDLLTYLANNMLNFRLPNLIEEAPPLISTSFMRYRIVEYLDETQSGALMQFRHLGEGYFFAFVEEKIRQMLISSGYQAPDYLGNSNAPNPYLYNPEECDEQDQFEDDMYSDRQSEKDNTEVIPKPQPKEIAAEQIQSQEKKGEQTADFEKGIEKKVSSSPKATKEPKEVQKNQKVEKQPSKSNIELKKKKSTPISDIKKQPSQKESIGPSKGKDPLDFENLESSIPKFRKLGYERVVGEFKECLKSNQFQNSNVFSNIDNSEIHIHEKIEGTNIFYRGALVVDGARQETISFEKCPNAIAIYKSAVLVYVDKQFEKLQPQLFEKYRYCLLFGNLEQSYEEEKRSLNASMDQSVSSLISENNQKYLTFKIKLRKLFQVTQDPEYSNRGLFLDSKSICLIGGTKTVFKSKGNSFRQKKDNILRYDLSKLVVDGMPDTDLRDVECDDLSQKMTNCIYTMDEEFIYVTEGTNPSVIDKFSKDWELLESTKLKEKKFRPKDNTINVHIFMSKVETILEEEESHDDHDAEPKEAVTKINYVVFTLLIPVGDNEESNKYSHLFFNTKLMEFDLGVKIKPAVTKNGEAYNNGLLSFPITFTEQPYPEIYSKYMRKSNLKIVKYKFQ